MVVTSIAAIGAGLILLYAVATIVRVSGGSSNATLGAQFIASWALAGVVLFLSIANLPVAVAIGLLPILLRIVAMVWFYYIGRKVLNGDFGEESQWAGELVESGDEEFIEASNDLSKMELRESGIIATDKSEMREIVVEKADDNDND